jgi:putative transposase
LWRSARLTTRKTVYITKYHRKIFDAAALDWLAGHAQQVLAKMDCRLLSSDGEADHLHILVECPPKLVLGNALKARRVGCCAGADQTSLLDTQIGFCGPPPYLAASAGGAPLAIIKQYVEQLRPGASSSP